MSFQAFHISGKLTVLPPILFGSTLVMLNKFDIKVYLETIQQHKVFNVLVSPVVILQIVKSPLSKDYDLSCLGYATCGGAPLSESLAKEFMQTYPQVMLTEAYGMSECTFSTFPLCDRRSNFAAAGYITPGYEAKIIDLETGEELGPNEKGEYIVKGLSLMSEYHRNPQATNASKDEEGSFHTGDLGYFTEKGELFIIDRKKDLMKINDHQVAPAEIESALAIDPRILDVAVVGIPHLKSGQVPAAFIVKKDQTLTEAEVLFFIKQRIAEFKWGEGVITFVDSIPKVPSGKVVRRQLLELLD